MQVLAWDNLYSTGLIKGPGGSHHRGYHTGGGDEAGDVHLIKEDTMTKIVFSPVPPERADAVTELLLNSFFRDEPLGIALGLPIKQVERWLPLYIRDSIVKSGTSFMAIDTETDKVVGVSVNVIKYSDNSKNLNMADYIDSVNEPTMAQIAKFLGYLGRDIHIPNNPDRVLTILFLNVESHYGGRGIAQDLTRKSEEYAQSLGINTFQVDTTSEFSYKVYKKLGYETLREEKFAEYEDNGVKILSNVDMGPHQHARFLYKIAN